MNLKKGLLAKCKRPSSMQRTAFFEAKKAVLRSEEGPSSKPGVLFSNPLQSRNQTVLFSSFLSAFRFFSFPFDFATLLPCGRSVPGICKIKIRKLPHVPGVRVAPHARGHKARLLPWRRRGGGKPHRWCSSPFPAQGTRPHIKCGASMPASPGAAYLLFRFLYSDGVAPRIFLQ